MKGRRLGVGVLVAVGAPAILAALLSLKHTVTNDRAGLTPLVHSRYGADLHYFEFDGGVEYALWRVDTPSLEPRAFANFDANLALLEAAARSNAGTGPRVVCDVEGYGFDNYRWLSKRDLRWGPLTLYQQVHPNIRAVRCERLDAPFGG